MARSRAHLMLPLLQACSYISWATSPASSLLRTGSCLCVFVVTVGITCSHFSSWFSCFLLQEQDSGKMFQEPVFWRENGRMFNRGVLWACEFTFSEAADKKRFPDSSVKVLPFTVLCAMRIPLFDFLHAVTVKAPQFSEL